jgi:signal peptidase complex subunit 3
MSTLKSMLVSRIRFRSPDIARRFCIVSELITPTDLSPLFNWNTKQLFLYLDAEYTNAKGVRPAFILSQQVPRRSPPCR